MQMRERSSGIGQIRQDARRGKTWAAPVLQQSGEVVAVDPIHSHHVVIAVEEVLTHQRERRMRRDGQQDARLVEQIVPLLSISDRPDLQRDQTTMLAVECLHDPGLAAGTQRVQNLVALPDQRCHRPVTPFPALWSWPTVRPMGPQVEVMFGVQSWRFELQSERTTVGKAPENDIVLVDDPTASHLHAMLERFPAGWCVTDLGSSNGTSVNGERIWASRHLRHGDEIRLGQTRLIFRDP